MADYMAVPDVARVSDVHPETVRTAIKRGRLAEITAFEKVLIARTDVEAYAERARPDGVKLRGRTRGPGGGMGSANAA